MGGVAEAAVVAAVVIGTTAYQGKQQRKEAQKAREQTHAELVAEGNRKKEEELRSRGMAEARARRVQQRAGTATQTDLTGGNLGGINAAPTADGSKTLLGY